MSKKKKVESVAILEVFVWGG